MRRREIHEGPCQLSKKRVYSKMAGRAIHNY
jgi:hypothetical protein